MCVVGISRYVLLENVINSVKVVIEQMKGFKVLIVGNDEFFEIYMKEVVVLED